MKRCLPVILYCGWFLMMPPTDKTKVSEDSPLSQWVHLQSFDAAVECENDKVKLADSFKKQGKLLQQKAIVLSRCIPADSISIK